MKGMSSPAGDNHIWVSSDPSGSGEQMDVEVTVKVICARKCLLVHFLQCFTNCATCWEECNRLLNSFPLVAVNFNWYFVTQHCSL